MQYATQESLILALHKPSVFPHSTEHWQLIETHNSWVVLCGAYAYKIKKALDLGFLDFTALEKCRFYCTEELRLNSRLAPALYLAVIPITGTAEQAYVGGTGRPRGMPLRILYFCADPAALRQRIESRQRKARDISEVDVNVLEHQLARYAGLDDGEQNETIVITTSLPCSNDKVALQVMQLLA